MAQTEDQETCHRGAVPTRRQTAHAERNAWARRAYEMLGLDRGHGLRAFAHPTICNGSDQSQSKHIHAHSIWMPTDLIRVDHLVSSRSMIAAYSSGVVGSGSAPSCMRRR